MKVTVVVIQGEVTFVVREGTFASAGPRLQEFMQKFCANLATSGVEVKSMSVVEQHVHDKPIDVYADAKVEGKEWENN